jgi:hypothetical protein
VWISGAQATT